MNVQHKALLLCVIFIKFNDAIDDVDADFKHSYSLATHTIILYIIDIVEVGGAQDTSCHAKSNDKKLE